MEIKLDELLAINPYRIDDAKQFTQEYIDYIFVKMEYALGQTRGRDFYTPIKNGKEWLYELTLKHQPKTGKVLQESGELMLVATEEPKAEYFKSMLVQEVNGRMIEVFRELNNLNPSDDNYKQIDDRETCLPEPLRAAYYHRFSGLSVLYEPRTSFLSANLLLPNLVNWSSIDVYLGKIRQKKKLLPWIEDIFPNVAHEYYYNLVSFLNVWHSKKEADILFAKTHIQDGIIYYVKDHDVKNMMILSDPIEAIDSYCEHVLLRKEGRFDFMPYTSKMDI